MDNEIINEFDIQNQKSVGTEMAVTRQAQEVQAAMVIAKRFPRDENAAFARIIRACERKSLAESAMYEYPRGGTKVTGPSIRLAETIAQNWGNIDFGMIELEQNNGESTVMSYAWDLETNTRRQAIFTVKHVRDTKYEKKALTDSRDIYELIANMAARRTRACILAVIPGDVVDKAVAQCQKTLAGDNKMPLEDLIRDMITIFDREHQVSQVMLENYIGCKSSAFTRNDVLRLARVHKSLSDGMATRAQYFDVGSSGVGIAVDSVLTNSPTASPKESENTEESKQAGETSIITAKQVTRLYTLAKGNRELVNSILLEMDYDSAKDIRVSDYDIICKAVEDNAGS